MSYLPWHQTPTYCWFRCLLGLIQSLVEIYAKERNFLLRFELRYARILKLLTDDSRLLRKRCDRQMWTAIGQSLYSCEWWNRNLFTFTWTRYDYRLFSAWWMCHELVYYFSWDSVSHIQCSSNKAYFLDCIDKIEDFWGWREVWRAKKGNTWGKVTFGGARFPLAWLLSSKKGVAGQCFTFGSKTWARSLNGVHH